MKKIIKKENDIRHWAEPLLQGLTFWLGYKKQLYQHYPLSEGAVIGEAVHLIYSNLYKEEKLECEKMYNVMGLKDAGKTRADLVISDGNNVIAVIEVKRSLKNYKLIEDDFDKLTKLKNTNNDIRCFLLFTSQGSRPKIFVNKNGRAIGKDIKGKKYIAHVRMVRKAGNSFKNKEKANYACLIEIKSKN